nr:MAG TPA: hypothetical protein [Caudoviricetes sp.]
MEKKMDVVCRLFSYSSDKVCIDVCMSTPHIDVAYTEIVGSTGAENFMQEIMQQGIRYIKTTLEEVDLVIDEIDSMIGENTGEMSIQTWIRSNGDVEFIVLSDDVMEQAYDQAAGIVSALNNQ